MVSLSPFVIVIAVGIVVVVVVVVSIIIVLVAILTIAIIIVVAVFIIIACIFIVIIVVGIFVMTADVVVVVVVSHHVAATPLTDSCPSVKLSGPAGSGSYRIRAFLPGPFPCPISFGVSFNMQKRAIMGNDRER